MDLQKRQQKNTCYKESRDRPEVCVRSENNTATQPAAHMHAGVCQQGQTGWNIWNRDIYFGRAGRYVCVLCVWLYLCVFVCWQKIASVVADWNRCPNTTAYKTSTSHPTRKKHAFVITEMYSEWAFVSLKVNQEYVSSDDPEQNFSLNTPKHTRWSQLASHWIELWPKWTQSGPKDLSSLNTPLNNTSKSKFLLGETFRQSNAT